VVLVGAAMIICWEGGGGFGKGLWRVRAAMLGWF
jgi:hypothetical protein